MAAQILRVGVNPKHGFLLAAAEYFAHCLRCLPPGESCERHAPECEDGKALYNHMRQLSGEDQ